MQKHLPIPNRIPFTKDGYQKVLDEKQELLEKRPEAVRELSDARSMGDLSENGYYKASRAKLSRIDGRLRHLEKLIRLGKIVEKSRAGVAGFGSTVTITNGTKEYIYTLVGGHESDPKNNTVSHHSPLGKALMNKKPGDSVHVFAPSGVKEFRIVSVV